MVTGVWDSGIGDGVLLTTQAFEEALPGVGPYLLLAGVLCLSFSSMLGFSYYVVKCGCFLFGQKARLPMLGFYLLTIVVSAVVKMDVIINFLDIAFGLMAIPTILSSIFLAPKVNRGSQRIFQNENLIKKLEFLNLFPVGNPNIFNFSGLTTKKSCPLFIHR